MSGPRESSRPEPPSVPPKKGAHARDLLFSRSVSEKHWQDDVLEIAQLFGWRCYHTFDSRRSHPGFPDLVLARPPVVIAAELKTDKGRLSLAQRDWLAVLEACDRVQTRLWRPQDRDRVLEELCPDTIRIHVE
jgi:hypothetical protein